MYLCPAVPNSRSTLKEPLMRTTKERAFGFGALIQTVQNYFKTDTISGLTKALEKEKAESIRKGP